MAEDWRSEEKIRTLANGSVLVDYGPMRMVISAWEHGRPLVDLAREGGSLATKVLEDLARYLPIIKKKSCELEVDEAYPDVVLRMIGATRKMGEPDLTPMAAVAGAASDVVADFMISRGGTKVIVDNGGDIAIRLRGGERARVGVKTDVLAGGPTYLIPLDSEMGVGGVATSGLGGRSFTKGIASAATVLSETASVADAAATVVGNFTNVESPQIERSLAEEIYPDTDIAGEWVTVRVGALPDELAEEALRQGLVKAETLLRRGYIRGALVAVQGRVGWTDSMNLWITKIS